MTYFFPNMKNIYIKQNENKQFLSMFMQTNEQHTHTKNERKEKYKLP